MPYPLLACFVMSVFAAHKDSALQSKLAYPRNNSCTIANRLQPALNALTEAAYDLCSTSSSVLLCQASTEKSFKLLFRSLFKSSSHLTHQVICVVCRYKRRLHALWSYLRGTAQAPAVSQLRQKVLQGKLLHCACSSA